MANGIQTKPPLQHVPPRADESYRVLEFKDRAPGCSWHFHPEYQLSLVLRGQGKRVVGDTTRPIKPGEVTLLGPNLPHVWKYDPGTEVHVIVVHFVDTFAGTDFLNRPEARSLRLLLARASAGVEVGGPAREIIAEKMRLLLERNGLARMIDLLEILDCLSLSEDAAPISRTAGPASGSVDLERLRCVYDFVDEHLHEPVTREQVAGLAHLNPSAFSRFFRQHTGLTFQEYLNERRMGRACELLLDPDLSISEVAFDCGFTTPTSFTRAFRRARGKSPSEFREELSRILIR